MPFSTEIRARRRNRLAPLGWFALALLIAWGLMRLVPALQSPDENSHLLRADMLAHGQLTLRKDEPDEVGNQGGYVDRHFMEFVQNMSAISGHDRDPDASARQLMGQASQARWAHQDMFVNAAGTGYYSPFIYLPHALGLRLARTLDLPMRASYELTRALVTLTTLGLIAWAWRILSPNTLARALLLMPMAIFQILSPTIDGLSIALALLLASLFAAQCLSPRDRTDLVQECALYACTFLLVTSRTNLAPLLLLPLWLLARNFSGTRLLAWLALCIASAGWTLYGLATTADTRLVRAHSTLEIIVLYARDPLGFARLVAHTVTDPNTGYFYAYSFVGMLGWLDASIPRDAMETAWGCLALALVATVWSTTYARRDIAARSVLLFAALSSMVLIFFALAISWNDYPVQIISGVQGRYFIVPVLLMAVAVGPLSEKAAPVHRAIGTVLTAVFAFGSLYILATTLHERYAMWGP